MDSQISKVSASAAAQNSATAPQSATKMFSDTLWTMIVIQPDLAHRISLSSASEVEPAPSRSATYIEIHVAGSRAVPNIDKLRVVPLMADSLHIVTLPFLK
jgi:hypothetical protein